MADQDNGAHQIMHSGRTLWKESRGDFIGSLLVSIVVSTVGVLVKILGGLDPWVIVGGIVSGLLLGCTFFAVKRTKPLLLIVIMLITIVLALGCMAYLLTQSIIQLYEEYWPPSKTFVLVADIEGPDPSYYRVTERILNRLRAAPRGYEDVEIVPLSYAITEQQGSDFAREVGQEHKATIVIWGYYGLTKSTVSLSLYYEVLRPPRYMPDVGPDFKGEPREWPVAELHSFELQSSLSEDLRFLILLTEGLIQYSREDWLEAISSFDDALKVVIDTPSKLDVIVVYLYRGLTYLEIGDYRRAIADFDEAVLRSPMDPRGYDALAHAYRRMERYETAAAQYGEVIRLAPQNPWGYMNRGETYALMGRFDLAARDFTEGIQRSANDPSHYVTRGNAFVAQGLFEQAVDDFTVAVNMDPTNPWHYFARASALLALDRTEEAIADMSTAIDLEPESSVFYMMRAAAHRQRGDHDSVSKDLNRAKELTEDPTLQQQADRQLETLEDE